MLVIVVSFTLRHIIRGNIHRSAVTTIPIYINTFQLKLIQAKF